jgi:hypothetical protein
LLPFRLADCRKISLMMPPIQNRCPENGHRTHRGFAALLAVISVFTLSLGAALANPFDMSFDGLTRDIGIETNTLFQMIQKDEPAAGSTTATLPTITASEKRKIDEINAALKQLQAVTAGLQITKADPPIADIVKQVDALRVALAAGQLDETKLRDAETNLDRPLTTLVLLGNVSVISRQRVVFPITLGQAIVLGVTMLIAITLALTPPVTFAFLRGLNLKRKQVTNVFDEHTCRVYFRYYWANRKCSSDTFKKLRELKVTVSDKVWKLNPDDTTQAKLLRDELEGIYNEFYGRSKYVLPLIGFAITLTVSVGFVVRSALYYCQIDSAQLFTGPPHILFNAAQMAAVTGAYLWVVGDGLRRMRVNDYLPSDVYAHLLRMVIAIPMGIAVGFVAPPGLEPFVAFSIGTFPLDTVSRYIRIIATRTLGVSDDIDTDGDEVKGLIGVNNDIAHRLMTEDVDTTLDLANCDPIRVMMRTNIDFAVVLDMMNQAIVSVATTMSGASQSDGAQKVPAQLIDILRISGLARATQIRRLLEMAKRQEEGSIALLEDLPGLTSLRASQLSNLFSNIAEDSRTELIRLMLVPPDDGTTARKENNPRPSQIDSRGVTRPKSRIKKMAYSRLRPAR